MPPLLFFWHVCFHRKNNIWNKGKRQAVFFTVGVWQAVLSEKLWKRTNSQVM